MPKYAEKKGGVNMKTTEKAPARRGRPRAQYKCEVSGRVCPFNDAFFEIQGAKYECPIKAYEKEPNYTDAEGIYHITSDYCKHLLDRDGGA